jgi:large subunit ribosomal protein L15
MPMQRRLPKRGFTNPFPTVYQPVNLCDLKLFTAGAEIDPAALRAAGLATRKGRVKILAMGSIDRALTVHAHAFSRAAVDALTAAGGKAVVIETAGKA